MTPADTMIGQVFGRLTVLHRTYNVTPVGGQIRPTYVCRCQCGQESRAQGHLLRAGKVKSCGCLKSERVHRSRNPPRSRLRVVNGPQVEDEDPPIRLLPADI